MKEFLTDVMKTVVVLVEHASRKTAQAVDVVRALKMTKNIVLYGYSDPNVDMRSKKRVKFTNPKRNRS